MPPSPNRRSSISLQARAQAELERRRRIESGRGLETSYGEFKDFYYDRPDLFVRDCFDWPDGDGPAEYQAGAMLDLVAAKRLAVVGPRGLGKTALVSWAVLWFALTRDGGLEDWKILTTAGAWRQLELYLWPEVHKWVKRLRWSKVGRAPFRIDIELMSKGLRLRNGSAMAVTSNDPDLTEGAHADKILYIFDEAKSIPASIYDAAEGTFSSNIQEYGREAFVLAASTPGIPEGRFYEICNHSPGLEDWKTKHVTLEECITAKRINPVWAENRRRQWGEASPVYQNQVLGQFARGSSAGIIPYEWVEAAVERWYNWQDTNFRGNASAFGVDVGTGGTGDNNDKATIAVCFDGMRILRCYPLSFKSQGTAIMEVAGHAKMLHDQYGRGDVVVDANGIGAGVYSRLYEQRVPAIQFMAQSATSLTADHEGRLGFANWRSAAWWILRDMLNPDNGFDLCLPPDTDETSLLSDLTAPMSSITSSGRIIVEAKDSIRKRIHRSTDFADAVVMAIAGPVLQAAYDETQMTEYRVHHEDPAFF